MDVMQLYTGIILAGGHSSRLGIDKGLIDWHGRKIIEYAIDILAPFCPEIIISSNNPDYQQFSYRIIPDIRAGHGPMMGLFSALKGTSTRSNLVLAVDNILVTGAFYQYLLEKDLSDCWIAIPFIHNQFYEPLVGYYKTDCISVMDQMMKAGNYKLPDLFSKVPVARLNVESDFSSFHPDYFRSLNLPEDLTLLNALPHGRS